MPSVAAAAVGWRQTARRTYGRVGRHVDRSVFSAEILLNLIRTVAVAACTYPVGERRTRRYNTIVITHLLKYNNSYKTLI